MGVQAILAIGELNEDPIQRNSPVGPLHGTGMRLSAGYRRCGEAATAWDVRSGGSGKRGRGALERPFGSPQPGDYGNAEVTTLWHLRGDPRVPETH